MAHGSAEEDLTGGLDMTGGLERADVLVLKTLVDCRDRGAQEILAGVLPLCREARTNECRAVIVIENLEFLADSIVRLLKAFDRLAAEPGPQFHLADRSRFADAFLDALSVNAHLQ